MFSSQKQSGGPAPAAWQRAFLPTQSFLFQSGPQFIGWGSLTWGKVICFTQFIDSNAHLSQKHPHRHTLGNNWPASGHCVAQLSGHIKPSNTGESKGGREWGVSCSRKRYMLQSLVQDQMAKVKRVELGEARGWWMLPYGGENWVTASALRLLQSLSSSIFRKVISLLAPGANSSRQEGILWWWRHHHQVDALVKSWNTLGTIFGQGDGIFENLPSASPAHAGLLRFIELILSYCAAPFCSVLIPIWMEDLLTHLQFLWVKNPEAAETVWFWLRVSCEVVVKMLTGAATVLWHLDRMQAILPRWSPHMAVIKRSQFLASCSKKT